MALVGDSGALYATAADDRLLLVFAEVMPKTVAINYPDRMSLAVARTIAFFVTLFGPVLCRRRDDRARRHCCSLRPRLRASRHPLLTAEEELKSAVDLMHKEGGVARYDRDMFGGLLDLRELAVSDVMVHRTKMLALNADLPTAGNCCARWSPRLIRACRCGAASPTTSSASCTPRICCAR